MSAVHRLVWVGAVLWGAAAPAWGQPADEVVATEAGAGDEGAGESPGTGLDDAARAEAEERFDRGVAFTVEGNYGAALAEFLRAYELTGHWLVAYNLGQVSMALERKTDAAHYYERCLADGAAEIEADRRGEVERALSGLRAELGRLRVEVDVAGAEVLIDNEVVGTAPLDSVLYVPPGPHVVAVRHAEHGALRREVMSASGIEESVVLALINPETPIPLESPVVPDTAIGAGGEDEGSVWTEWWLWTIIGSVVVGGAATATVLLVKPGTVWTAGSVDPLLLP